MASYLLKQGSQASTTAQPRPASGDNDRTTTTTTTTTRGRKGDTAAEAAAAGEGTPSLRWMLGARSLRDVLQAVVLKRRSQMLWLLHSHGLGPPPKGTPRGAGEPPPPGGKTLLDIARAVPDNAEVVALLTRYGTRGTSGGRGGGGGGKEERIYDNATPLGGGIKGNKLGQGQKTKKSTGVKKLLGL